MQYLLPDGRSFETEEIRELTSIRDYGSDDATIVLSKIGFTIHLKKGKSIQVMEHYHFTDWAEAKLKVSRLRDDIMRKWQSPSAGQ